MPSLRIECIQSPPLGTNVYLVPGETPGGILVIDPSFAFDQIMKRCHENNWRVESILITHGHIDHTHDAARLARETGAPVYAHAGTLPFLSDSELSGADYLGLPFEPCTDARPLADGDTIPVNGMTLKALFAPGHSPGCLCFLAEDQSFCFTGDVLFRDGVGRWDLYGGNHDTLMSSIRRLLSLCQDTTVLYPGHGPQTTAARERRNNP